MNKNNYWASYVFIFLIGITIRIFMLYDRSFSGDEVGTIIHINKSFNYILSHFETWLTMNYFIAFEKLVAIIFGINPYSLGFLPFISSIATILFTILLANQFTTPKIALMAGLLVAVNPYLIQYSVIIRSYAPLTALSLLLLITYFKWEKSPDLRHGIRVAICAFLLVLMHPNGALSILTVICYCVVYIFSQIIITLKSNHGQVSSSTYKKIAGIFASIFIPMLVAGLFTGLAYYQIIPEMLEDGKHWNEVPPSSISYIPFMLGEYLGEGLFSLPAIALFIVGIFNAYKYSNKILSLIPVVILPIFFVSLQGLSHFPWGYTRFLIFILPVILIFVACGIHTFIDTKLSHWKGGALLICIAIVFISWLPQLQNKFYQKANNQWQQAAAFITSQYQTGDLIIGSSWSEPFHLSPYLTENKHINVELNSALLQRGYFKNNENKKVFFVVNQTQNLISPNAYRYGNIQVVIYDTNALNTTAQLLIDDLITTTTKSGQNLSLMQKNLNLYRNIGDIYGYLAKNEKASYYYRAHQILLGLTRREVYKNTGLRIAEAQSQIKNLPLPK